MTQESMEAPSARKTLARPAARRRVWPLVVLAIVLVAAAAFAVGRFTAFGRSEGPNAADIGFARDMQVHHAQAVEMAMTEYAATGDDDLRLTAYDIATGQSAQGGEMYGWLVEWGVAPYSSDPLMSWMADTTHLHAAPDADEAALRESMGMATDGQLADLRESAGTPSGDCLFIELMTRHHRGALDMTEAVQDLGAAPRVHQVSNAMAETQTREIEALEDISTRIGCE